MQNSAPASGSRPRIGIPVRLSSSADSDLRVAEANGLFDYVVDLVRGGGGEPVLLALEVLSAGGADVFRALDGVILPGGGDLDPRLYGEEPGKACYDVNPEQDCLDSAVARRAIAAGLPLFGICRGHQLLNVLYGGTLTQDMTPGTVRHRDSPAEGAGIWAWHDVMLTPGSKVAGLYGEVGDGAGGALSVKIASGHHQAVSQVAPGLVVTAVADDGTVEALEDPDRWVASVQWHPEVVELPDAQRQAPFRAFVEVCHSLRS
ncbi:MAG: gamma-glutamyl-gamma-aminobutyrate hydrolase family protein [Actinomycetota bacterium]|nr:gamma-glutamyl-gamma-aminobutyrate hydrolase family protein [Actinomycetota bacterium]